MNVGLKKSVETLPRGLSLLSCFPLPASPRQVYLLRLSSRLWETPHFIAPSIVLLLWTPLKSVVAQGAVAMPHATRLRREHAHRAHSPPVVNATAVPLQWTQRVPTGNCFASVKTKSVFSVVI